MFNQEPQIQPSLGGEASGTLPEDKPSQVGAQDYESLVLSDTIAAEACEEPVPDPPTMTSGGTSSSHLSAEALNSLPQAEFFAPDKAF